MSALHSPASESGHSDRWLRADASKDDANASHQCFGRTLPRRVAPPRRPSTRRQSHHRVRCHDVEPEREAIQKTDEIAECLAVAVDSQITGRERLLDGDLLELNAVERR